MPNENLFYFVRFSIFHQKSTFNFSWNYVRFRRFLQKNFFTFDFDFRKKIFFTYFSYFVSYQYLLYQWYA